MIELPDAFPLLNVLLNAIDPVMSSTNAMSRGRYTAVAVAPLRSEPGARLLLIALEAHGSRLDRLVLVQP